MNILKKIMLSFGLLAANSAAFGLWPFILPSFSIKVEDDQFNCIKEQASKGVQQFIDYKAERSKPILQLLHESCMKNANYAGEVVQKHPAACALTAVAVAGFYMAYKKGYMNGIFGKKSKKRKVVHFVQMVSPVVIKQPEVIVPHVPKKIKRISKSKK